MTESTDTPRQKELDRLTGKALRLADELGIHDEVQKFIYQPTYQNDPRKLGTIVIAMEIDLENKMEEQNV